MIEQRHSAPHAARVGARAAIRAGHLSALAVLFAAAGLAGCRHKPVRSPLPIGALAPVELESPAPPESPPTIATLPPPELGPLSGPELPPPPRRRPATPPKETQPTQVAGNDATATLAIGALSLGGEDTTHSAQQAQDLINSVLKRIAALPASIANAQEKQIRQIRNFLDQAQKALKSGDAEGANSLATKAKLLMDDLEKK